MAVYSMTGYASASAGAALSAPQLAPKATRPSRRKLERQRDSRIALGQWPLSRPLAAPARRIARPRAGTARPGVGGVSARQDRAAPEHPRATATTRLAAAAARAAQPALPPSGHGAQLAARRPHGLSVHEVLQWCKGGQRGRAARRARPGRGARWPLPACARLAHAKARGWPRCCWSAWPGCANWPRQAEPLVPAVVQRQQQRFLERWHEALAVTGAAQAICARSAAGACVERSGGVRHPHRRGRRIGPPARAPRRDRPSARSAAAKSASGSTS